MSGGLIYALIAFSISFLVVALTLGRRWHWALDRPNERSLHTDPTPRTGGLALMAGMVVAAVTASFQFEHFPAAAPALAVALAIVSMADDRSGLPIVVRLGAHLMAAGAFAYFLGGDATPWWWICGAIIAITAMTNFYNFMDGANGLAGGMALAGFGCYAMASLDAAPGFAMLCLAIAAAAAGFLCFNLPGRIFMGDGGSVPLGFLAAALGLEGWMRGLWPVWFAPLVFAPFVADAVVTLLRRMLRGERFWQAHREHYYQRLVRSGWSHTRLAGAEYALMLTCAAAALVARSGDPQARDAAFATIAVLLLGAGAMIDRRWRRHLASQTQSR